MSENDKVKTKENLSNVDNEDFDDSCPMSREEFQKKWEDIEYLMRKPFCCK
ncbi:MAG: hypothetical protein ACTSRA_10680 [Promethearchaeota archaeon]